MLTLVSRYYWQILVLVILSVEKTDAQYNNMHTAEQRKIATLRRADDATAREIFLLCR